MAKRGLFFHILAVIAGITGGLLALEIIFGGWFRDNAMSRLNLVHDRTIHYDLNGIYKSESGEAIYRRDQYGLRGFYRSPETIDILTLGGSATDQRFITEGATWHDRMREAWLKNNRDITVVNAGVDGQSTLGHLKNFEWWFPHIPNLKPKFILCYIGVNDLFGNVGTVWDAIERPEAAQETAPAEEREQLGGSGEHSEGLWNRITSAIEEKSALAYLLRTATGIMRARHVKLDHGRGFLRGPGNWTDRQMLPDPAALVTDDLKGYAERVKLLLAHIRGIGARPIIVTQAAHYYLKDGDKLLGFNDPGFQFKDHELLGVDVYYLLKAYSDTALETCRAAPDCIPINLFDELPLTTGDYYDNVHLTPQGAQKMAEFLVEKLEPVLSETFRSLAPDP